MKKILCLLLAFMMLWTVSASALVAVDTNVSDASAVAKNYEGAVFAAYDESGKLIAVSTDASVLPDNAKNVKLFATGKAKAEEKLVGAFVNKNENPDDTWVVGITGASAVQSGCYSAFLYQYYATRYPDKNIILVNKGSAGCTAWDIYKRLNWDIFNEDDPLGYGACDEIAIMVGANDLGYPAYSDGKMAEDEYEAYYDGKKKYQNNPEKAGSYVPDMTRKVEECFNTYKRVIKWCKDNGKGVTLTPMTLYDESDAFESTLSYGVCYGANHAFGMLSDRLEQYAKEEGIPFIDTWGLSNEYTEKIRKENPGITTVITGTDGLHHSTNGGYLVGYIIANDAIVAKVSIDATAETSTTDRAEVSNLSASATKVAYTYMPKALPLYAKAPGYTFAEDCGVDITNTMNREIIEVAGLESGTYILKMDGKKVAEFTAQQLAEGVNIATLENNPGQIQSKALHDNYYDKRRLAEAELRHIFNEELRIRNVMLSNYSTHYDDPKYKEYTAQDWIDLCNKLVAEGYGTLNADTYPEKKLNQDNIVAEVRACIEGMAKDSIPTSHKVEIIKK